MIGGGNCLLTKQASGQPRAKSFYTYPLTRKQGFCYIGRFPEPTDLPPVINAKRGLTVLGSGLSHPNKYQINVIRSRAMTIHHHPHNQ
jgi:hypothetical protein